MRTIGLYFFTLVFFHSSFQNALAQEYSWKNYSVTEGLPQTQVISMMQDSEGFIWLGTKNGISIFDGIEFENYSTKDGLDFGEIDKIQEISSGVFYISTRSGLSLVRNRKIIPVVRNLPHAVLFQLADGDGNLWFNFPNQGLMLYDSGVFNKSHEVFEYLELGEVLDCTIIRKKDKNPVFSSSFGNVFFPTDNGFRKVETDRPMNLLLEGADGHIYGSTSDALYQIDEDGVSLVFRFGKQYSVLYINNQNDFYLCDYGKGGTLFHYLNGLITRMSDRFNLIAVLLIDDEENLWLGTDSGLWKMQGRAFQNYLIDPANHDYAWSVLQDKNGDFIFGSYNFRLKKLKNGSFIDIPTQHLFNAHPVSFYSGSIKNDEGDLLITTARGVLTYNGNDIDWFYNPSPATSILYIYDDRKYNKYLLASSDLGLVEIDDAGKASVYGGRLAQEHTELITSIMRDKYDRIWISGKKGVSIREANRWRHLPDKKDSIPIGAISMLLDSAQNIWLGSNDGLYFYDYSRLQKIAPDVFTTQIGVLNTTNDNALVIGSINGLGIIDLHDFYRSGKAAVRFFDHNTGFQGVECKHNSSFKDDQGNIWICTSNCVVKVIPQELKTNPYPPRVYINSINASYEGKKEEQIHRFANDTLPLVFDSRQENLRFNYHAISLSAPNGVRYRTMLEGFDNDWSVETKERYRTYTNLPHRDYTFKVMACNFDGVWTPEAVEVSFTIKPAWHELLSVKISGIVGIAAFAAGIGYILSEQRRRKKIKEDQVEKNIAKLQFKSLKGMIDPHFTFNAINSIASMVYSQNRDEAYWYFTKFSRLIRNVFEHAENTTRTLDEELDFVKNYLDIEKMRFGDKFNYVVTTSAGLNMQMEIPKLLIQIYVENAIKHGLMSRESGGKLEVILSDQNNQLEIVIRDNGIGRTMTKRTNPANHGLGKGTTIIQQYFDLLNRFNERKIASEIIDLNDNNGLTAGTEVHITIPYDFKYSL